MARWAWVLVLAVSACASDDKPKRPYVLPLTRPASATAGAPATSQPPDYVNMTVRENRRGLIRCQSRYLEAVGELDLSFFIDEGGHARNIRVALDELKTPAMTTCVSRFIESLTFPQPVRGTDQLYRAHFKPDDVDKDEPEL